MHEWGEPSPVPPLAANPDPPHKKHPEECTWSDYCNDFEKSESIFFHYNKFTTC